MFKVVMPIKKRPDITREKFMDYYTNHHVPYIHKLLPKGAAVHRRNFVAAPSPLGPDDYDVISEVFYEDRATAEGAMKAFADPDIHRLAQEDEDQFILPGSIKRYIVEVHETVYRPLPV